MWRPNREEHQQTYPARGRFHEVAAAVRRALPALHFGRLTLYPTRAQWRLPIDVWRVAIYRPVPVTRAKVGYTGEAFLSMQPTVYLPHPSGLPDSARVKR
jgi:hypothetical protein